jgi:hypothetical protein
MFYLIVTAEDIKMLSTNNNDYDHLGREKQVIDLYKQGKNTRDIAKELRMSLRDISIILRNNHVMHGVVTTITKDNGNDNTANSKSPNEKATQAYKLFSEDKKPVEVAVQLSLSEKEATRYYKEYWRLNHLYKLYQVYIEVEHCLPSFLKLHKALKKRGLNPDNVEWFADAIETGATKIPEIQKQYAKVKEELEAIDYKKTMAKYQLDDMNNKIAMTISSY